MVLRKTSGRMGTGDCALGILIKRPSIADLNTWSYAPILSTFKMVALSSVSVAARNTCPTQSVPACVESAHWSGAHSSSKSFANCLACVLACERSSVCASCGDSSHSPVILGQRGQSGTHQRTLNVRWNAPLSDAGGCLEDEVEHVRVVHHDLQMLVRPLPWTRRRPP